MTANLTYPSYQTGSGWAALLPKRTPKLVMPTDKSFDVAVIGAGVTGLAAARRVAELEPNSRVLLIDATTIGEGSSGRNSGFLINMPHNTNMAGHGSPAELARAQIKLLDGGLSWIKSLIDAHKLDCGWNPAGKYHAAATPQGEQSLRAVLEQYKEWGVDYRELGGDELKNTLGTDYYRYGFFSPNSVFVQPAALVRGLADSLPENVYLWENEPVFSVEPGKPYVITTRSASVKAGRVIIANNGFARKLGFAKDRVFTIYTYAGITPQLDDDELGKLGASPEWGAIPANRLGTTLRKISSGRFMVRSAYSYEKENKISDVKAMLKSLYAKRYPNMKSHELEHVWGGVTALTGNGGLYFGCVRDGMYISICCNGAGLLKCSLFGKLLAEMACGQQSNELATVMGFDRPSWLPPEPVRKLAIVSAINYQKFKAGRER